MRGLLLAVWLTAAPARAETPPRSLIVISLGNVGIGHMSAYGYRRPTTPFLERFAREAVVFDHAYSPASWTLPVAASVFTGLAPRQHGLMSRYVENKLNPDVPTVAETLAKRGWSTGAFTGGLDYDRVFGHMRGFETLARNPNFEHLDVSLLEAERWLKRRAKNPFFLFVHGYDSHCPFEPDADKLGALSANRELPPHVACYRGYENSTGTVKIEFRPEWCRGLEHCVEAGVMELKEPLQRRLEELYDETVLQEDAAVERFLTRIPADIRDSAVIVIYGDHGEMFAKHGRFGRNGVIRGVLYEDVVRVPLMIKAPGLAPRRISSPVELMDLARTFVELAGISAPGAMGGTSLLDSLRTGRPIRDRQRAGLLFLGWTQAQSVST